MNLNMLQNSINLHITHIIRLIIVKITYKLYDFISVTNLLSLTYFQIFLIYNTSK